MKKFLLLFLALFVLSACTKDDNAERVLKMQGYTHVEITGYRFFGCDEKDVYRTGFRANAPNGQPCEGVVCEGWFKSATVRVD